ncbi:MAG: saccharopine dehydrogenase NADP-binding domain-containing protein [Pseudomonadota bacterium]
MAKKPFDVVVWGASGFTGQLVVEYLASRYGVDGDLRWAIAGRNADKLEQAREECLPRSKRNRLPIIIADSTDPESLAQMVAKTKVICSTVGPYAKYGTPLVAACAEAGVDYCDLTGEVQWMAQVIPDYQGIAEGSGARIVHTCGFDSIPFDMGTWYLQQGMMEQHGVYASRVKGRMGRMRGGASGGTIASMLNMLEESQHYPSIKQIMAYPYALNPLDVPTGPDSPDQKSAVYDKDFQQWTSPFVMAAVNTRVVRRSHALLGLPWGENFQYDEAMLNRSRLEAMGLSIGMGAGMIAMEFSPTRSLAARFLPSPGDGPSRRLREAGLWEAFFHGVHPAERENDLRLKVTGDMDPGYGSTSKMLGESAVCLALDDTANSGGFYTPSSAMGDALRIRLEENAGLTFEFIDL